MPRSRRLLFPQVDGNSLLGPGALVSNLDFVESIFGNAGDALVPENDAGLDIEHWTGHTGCVILAPHLIDLKKKDLGLPAWDQRPNANAPTRCAGKIQRNGITMVRLSS